MSVEFWRQTLVFAGEVLSEDLRAIREDDERDVKICVDVGGRK